jgi:cystathionine gamma-synthase
MLSFETKGGREGAMKAAANTKIFTRATSLGGVESLVEHRASIEGPGTTSPEGLLRLSIGLENAEDLIEDLDQAVR